MSNLINNIKILRELSGSGYLDCKNALQKNDNDIDKSIIYLRKQGLSKVSKKSLRVANEGAVGIFFTSKKSILIEINTETDFAAKNDVFLNFIEQIANFAISSSAQNELEIIDFMSTKHENRRIAQQNEVTMLFHEL